MKGMLPFDVINDTADQLRTGFGLTHKWDKRKKARRAELHAAGESAWEAAGRTDGDEVVTTSIPGTPGGGGGGGVTSDELTSPKPARPIAILNVPRLPESVSSQRTKTSRMSQIGRYGGGVYDLGGGGGGGADSGETNVG